MLFVTNGYEQEISISITYRFAAQSKSKCDAVTQLCSLKSQLCHGLIIVNIKHVYVKVHESGSQAIYFSFKSKYIHS